MGKLLDRYKANLQKNGYGTPQPDPDVKPQEYLEWRSNKRKIERYQTEFKDSFAESGFSADQVVAAFEKTFGKEKAEEIRNEIDNSNKKYTALQYGYIDSHPELISNLSEEDQKKFENDSKFRKQKISEWIQDGTIPKEEVDKNVVPLYFSEGFKLSGENPENLLDALEEQATEIQKQKIEERLDNYVELLDLPEEKRYEHPYEKTCEELKKDENIPDEIKNDKDLYNQYLHALDFAAKHLERPVKEYRDELFSRESLDVATLETPRTTRIRNANKATHKGGKYEGLFEEKKLVGQNMRLMKADRANDYKELRNDHVEVSEKALKGMKLILKKMDEMELYKSAASATGEDRNKEYAFCKLDRERKELEGALEKGDAKAIIEAEKKYEKTWNDLEELFAIAKEHFAQNPTDYPGNMDSIRTETLPIHFTQDLMTTAQVNNLYLMHLMIKQSGITLEEWEKNPSKLITDKILDKQKTNSFEDVSEKISGNYEESLDFLFHLGEYADHHNIYVSSSNIMGATRALDGLIMLDQDQQARNRNVVYVQEMNDAFNGVLNNEYCKFLYFNQMPESEQDRADRRQTLENLMLVNDKDRNLNAMLGGVPETDILGGITGKAMDPAEYAEKHIISADDLIKRAEILESKAERAAQKAINGKSRPPITRDEVKLAKLTAFEKYLDAHAYQSESYKKVLAEYNKTLTELRASEEPEIVTKAEELAAQRDRSVGTKNPDQLMEEINNGITEATVGVHNGSNEYKKAAEALEAVAKAYKELKDLDPTESYEKKKAAVENLRNKMQTADELIDKYFDRKTRQREMGENKKAAKDLDEKSQKRIRIMQRSKDSLKIYEKVMDNVDLELDREEVTRAKSTARAEDGKRMYDIQTEYSKAAEKAGAVDKNSMDYFVAKGAEEAYKALWHLSNGKTEDSLDEQQMQSAKKGLANLILHEVLKSPEGDAIRENKPKNLYTYNQELDKFCKSEAFEKIAPKTITT